MKFDDAKFSPSPGQGVSEFGRMVVILRKPAYCATIRRISSRNSVGVCPDFFLKTLVK